MEWVAVTQQLNHDLLAIEMARSGFAYQQQAILAIPLVDPDNEVLISKDEFKDLGSAQILIEQVCLEALIGLVANSIETCSIRLKRHLHFDWEPFKKPRNDIGFSERIRQFRALNNIFKHQEGYVEVASSRSAKFLVEGGYFADETYLKHLSAAAIVPELELAIFETFAHLYELTFSVAGYPQKFSGKSGADLVEALRKLALFPIIKPSLLRI